METKEKEPVGITEVKEADTVFAERKKQNEEQLALQKEIMRKLSEQKNEYGEKTYEELISSLQSWLFAINCLNETAEKLPAEQEKVLRDFMTVIFYLMRYATNRCKTLNDYRKFLYEYLYNNYTLFLHRYDSLRTLLIRFDVSIDPFMELMKRKDESKEYFKRIIELEQEIKKLKEDKENEEVK